MALRAVNVGRHIGGQAQSLLDYIYVLRGILFMFNDASKFQNGKMQIVTLWKKIRATMVCPAFNSMSPDRQIPAHIDNSQICFNRHEQWLKIEAGYEK